MSEKEKEIKNCNEIYTHEVLTYKKYRKKYLEYFFQFASDLLQLDVLKNLHIFEREKGPSLNKRNIDCSRFSNISIL